MKIIGAIGEAIRVIQTTYGIELEDTDFQPEQHEEVLHVLVHEMCHSAISHAAPWVNVLPDSQHTAVDEIAARVLETEISQLLSLPSHSVASHAQELSNYGIEIAVDTLEEFFAQWKALPRTPIGIEQLCQDIRDTLCKET